MAWEAAPQEVRATQGQRVEERGGCRAPPGNKISMVNKDTRFVLTSSAITTSSSAVSVATGVGSTVSISS